MTGNARDVTVDIIGRDRTAAATRSAAGNFDKVKAKASGLKEEFAKGAVAVAALAGAFTVAAKVMNAGLTSGLIKANAQVALGAKGYAELSAAANSSAHNLGLTTTEFINSAGQAALLAKNMGFGQDTAVSFGKLLPDLANRLSVLSSGSRTAAESSDMLRSALAGEFDPLQSVGINISANIVAQKALEIQQRSGNRLTQQQATSLAVLALVQEQTAQATDVMASAQGRAYINAQANTAALKEQWQTLSAQLTPALSNGLGILSEWVYVMGHLNELDKIDEVTKRFKDGANAAAKAAGAESVSVNDLAQTASGAATDVYAFARSLDYARDAANKSANAALADRDAARAYRQSIDDAKAALDQNGRGLDINTQKGRTNAEALDRIAASANKQAQAILDAGGSQVQFDRSLASSRAQLEAMAQRFGMTKAQAHAYALEVLSIPANVSTNIRQNIETLVNGTKVSNGYFERVLNAPRGKVTAFGGGATFVPFASGELGGGRTQAPAEVNVTSNVMLDGAPFYAMTHAAVTDSERRQAFRARAGRR